VPGSDSSTPKPSSVPAVPIQKGDGGHSPSDQLPLPGKGTPTGPSSPSHNAISGLSIPKQDGSKHSPSDALAVPSEATARSGTSTSVIANVPAMAMKKESGSDDVSVTSSPSASDPPAVLHGQSGTSAGGARSDAASDSLPVPSKVNPDPLTPVPSVTPRPVVAENAGTVSPVPSVAPSPAPQAALPQTVFVSIPRRRR
ncbi:hypothetical protein T03_11490, partial [Trichinella britovi]